MKPITLENKILYKNEMIFLKSPSIKQPKDSHKFSCNIQVCRNSLYYGHECT